MRWKVAWRGETADGGYIVKWACVTHPGLRKTFEAFPGGRNRTTYMVDRFKGTDGKQIVFETLPAALVAMGAKVEQEESENGKA